MRRRLLAGLAVVLGALSAGPAAALAHPLLVTSAPAPGSILPGPPSTLTLAFSEAAVPSGSAVSVKGPGGRAIGLGRLSSSAGGQQLSARLAGKLKPGVYRVHWVALGDDGHTVSGDFAFGVSESNGAPPPGAAAGLGGAGTAGRGGNASGQSIPSIALLWLGVLAASALWGGALLAVMLRRRRVPRAEEAQARLERLVPAVFAVAAVSVVYGLFQEASAGAGGGLHLGLLTASGTGISALARVAIVGLGATAAVPFGRRRAASALTGGALLVAYGLSGHVLAQHNALAALAMAAHVLAAGTWAGGLIALLFVVRRAEVPLRDAARAYSRPAIAGLSVAAVTGVLAAFREVSHWYFLWYSGYGRAVIVKVALVAAASTAGAFMALKARQRLAALEVGLVVLVIGAAGVLSGLAQGRGQPLPSQQGDLLPGPALTSVVTPSGTASVTLAPARPGLDSIVVTPSGHPRSVLVRLGCGCDVRPVIARLQAGAGSNGAFSASIPIPTAGTWNAYVSIDGRQADSPAALPVGVSGAPGAPVHNVLAIADLSGPGAHRCTNFLVGAELAIGRLNGAGGVDGGDKLALLAYDDGGVPERAATEATAALSSDSPVAVLPCGAGSEPAVTLASRRGVPAIEGDPATNDVPGARVFRLAADPYADGVALAQTIRSDVLPVSAPTARTVKILFAADEQGQRRLQGFEAGLAGVKPVLRIDPVSYSSLAGADSRQISSVLNRNRTVALVLDVPDVQAPALASAIGRLPATASSFKPAPVIASERLLSEGFVEAAGDAGRLGVVQGTSSVAVDSRDGLILSQALPALFPGESASLEGLRGYVTGLALDYGLANGTSATAVAARLQRPAPFTDAIAEPWLSTHPADGSQRLTVLDPTFLTTTLLPVSSGGEAYSGEYFPNGAWERPTSELFGPALTSRLPPLTP